MSAPTDMLLSRPLDGEILTADPLATLAKALYEAMEHLDPGTEDYIEWRDLPERDRDFYLLTIRRLLLRKAEFLELFSHDD
jgi:hypothetical protein